MLRRARATIGGLGRIRCEEGIEPAGRDGGRMRSPGTTKKSTGTGSDDHIFEIRHRGEGPCRHLADQALDLGRVGVAAVDVEADDYLTDRALGKRRRRDRRGHRFADEVRDRQTEFTTDPVRKVLLHPPGKSQRECREDDLVAGLTPKRGTYRLHGVGIPDFPVDLGPQFPEEGDGRFQVSLGYVVGSALGPREMFMGGRGGDDDVNDGGPCRKDVFHLLGQLITGKGLVPDHQVASHGSRPTPS